MPEDDVTLVPPTLTCSDTDTENQSECSLHQPTTPKDVGTVTINRGETLFQFDNSFLLDPLPFSPLHLPTTPGIHAYDRKGDMETFGMLEDSLPDGWGRKMINRHFRKLYNRTPTVLERLACVSTDGMGALCCYPE